MTEETPRFEGEVEGTYVEVKAEGPIGEKRLRITLGFPDNSEVVVFLVGDEVEFFETEVARQADVVYDIVEDGTECVCCSGPEVARWFQFCEALTAAGETAGFVEEDDGEEDE